MPTEIVIQDQLYKLFGNGDEDVYEDIVTAVDALVTAGVGILPALTAAVEQAAPTVTFTQTYSTADATVAAPTAVAPAALTAVAATGGESPTEAEYNALLADVTAIRAEVVKLVADDLDNRRTINKIIDVLQLTGNAL